MNHEENGVSNQTALLAQVQSEKIKKPNFEVLVFSQHLCQHLTYL